MGSRALSMTQEFSLAKPAWLQSYNRAGTSPAVAAAADGESSGETRGRGGGEGGHHAVDGSVLQHAAGGEVGLQDFVDNPGIQLHKTGLAASPGQGLQPHSPSAREQVQPGTVWGQLDMRGAIALSQQHVENGLPDHLHHRPRRLRISRQQAAPCKRDHTGFAG